MFNKVFIMLLLIFASTGGNAGKITVHKNEISGLLTWTAVEEGFKLEFIQLIPDFIRAIYAKHNFPAEEVERAASYCIFGTILKNTSNQHLSYRVANWRYVTKDENGKDGKSVAVKTKTQWLEEWQKAGITFSWTLLPDVGEFSVGDWQQGFTTIKLPRESLFDLRYKWKLDGVEHSGILKNMQCAPESLPEL